MIKDVQAWYRRNMALHGWAMLLLNALIYFGQGGRGYLDASVDWIAQYSMGIDPGTTETAKAVGRIPWNFKFLFGLVSDNFPILSYNVKPYMWLSTFIGAVGVAIMTFPFLSFDIGSLTLGYVVVQFYGAVADCLCDALVVKNGKHDEEDSSSALQSISWFSLGVGGALFNILGGFMSTGPEDVNDGVNVGGARIYNGIMLMFPVSLFVLLFFVKEEKTKFRPSPKAFMQQIVRLLVALFSPPFLVLRVLIWIMLSKISHLYMSSAAVAFRTSILKINPTVGGYIDAASYLFLAVGVVVYYRFFRTTSFRTLFLASQVLSAVIYLSDYPLSAKWITGDFVIFFLFASSAFSEVIDRLNAMPFLVMAGQLCPDNMEATFFAALMSMSNIGSTFSSTLGGTLVRALKINRKDPASFEGPYQTALLIRSGALVGVCIFLFLVPNTSALNPSNVETLRPTNPTIIKLLKWADMYYGDESNTTSSPKKVEV
jgi:Na+/melibiose symporter-like transporter